MSSSHRSHTSDAVIKKEAHATGAVLLPKEQPEDFIAEFNRTYASIGWKIESLPPTKVIKNRD
ncbi:hypothetical protein CA13_53670 [Planctomycetes bacterium CA13]|uniref:Uncharacterized protein n=1 Tax=Novipirellula herctigrandis TaxID=2527986 RepID=A0A5C5ZBG0_9BACT|nr:hypothetical protein CA13_53670 [Planctomycetes bacterium CA13]